MCNSPDSSSNYDEFESFDESSGFYDYSSDVVEEIQAELSHQRAQKPEKTYFEEYCEEHPEAFESRIYDA